jgi:hypothetical protein
MSNAVNSVNPYAAPAAPVDDVPANPQAEAVRRAHINHEASIKAVGFLYYLGGVLLTLGGVVSLVGASSEPSGAVVALLLVALGVGQLFAGWGVRALRPWGRIVGCVLSAIGLIGFPIGTLINAYILYLLLSKKGRMVFSPEYQDIIAATPHIKYRISIIVWIFLALLVALILFAAFAAFFGR